MRKSAPVVERARCTRLCCAAAHVRRRFVSETLVASRTRRYRAAGEQAARSGALVRVRPLGHVVDVEGPRRGAVQRDRSTYDHAGATERRADSGRRSFDREVAGDVSGRHGEDVHGLSSARRRPRGHVGCRRGRAQWVHHRGAEGAAARHVQTPAHADADAGGAAQPHRVRRWLRAGDSARWRTVPGRGQAPARGRGRCVRECIGRVRREPAGFCARSAASRDHAGERPGARSCDRGEPALELLLHGDFITRHHPCRLGADRQVHRAAAHTRAGRR
jgi:hypothetical protein